MNTLTSKHSSVHILAGRDQGPGTKLLFPLKVLLETNAFLIVVDDDQIYAKNHACDLLMVGEMYPSKAVTRRSRVLSSMCEMGNDYEDTPLLHRNSRMGAPQDALSSTGDIAMGTSGYLVRAQFFSSDIFNYAICPQDVRDALIAKDDLWVSAHLRVKRIPMITVLPGFVTDRGYSVGVPEKVRTLSREDGLWRASTSKVRVRKAFHVLSHLFCGNKNTIPEEAQCQFTN